MNWQKVLADLKESAIPLEQESNLGHLPLDNMMSSPEVAIDVHLDNLIATYGMETVLTVFKIRLEGLK